MLIPTDVMSTYLGQAYQQLDKLVANCFRLRVTVGLGTTLNTNSPKPPPDPLKVLPPLSCHATQKYTQHYLPSAFYYSDLKHIACLLLM